MIRRDLKPISFPNAKIKYRNFAGKAGTYNNEGNRNFMLVLSEEDALAMIADGWNVRVLEPKNEDDEKAYTLPVSVSFKKIPPKIMQITRKNKTRLEEDEVKMLDYAEIENIDLIINPSYWSRLNPKTKQMEEGIKAYLKSLWVTLAEDPFEEKYKDVPDTALASSEEFDNVEDND